MGVLGYSRWEKFENPIRAMSTAFNQGSTRQSLSPISESDRGRTWKSHSVTDYDLTRYSAYLAVMTQPEHASRGQHYFAVKTREAEVGQPVREPTLEEKALESWKPDAMR